MPVISAECFQDETFTDGRRSLANLRRCCWPTASRPALSADLAFRRYSASASPHFDDFVCFFERGVPPSCGGLWRHNRCVNRRGAERAFCDRRKRDLRQFDLRHVAPRQWFFRRCSLACSGRASARVCARLGGCCGQLAHTARSAARCIYLMRGPGARMLAL